jgi:hypothetical protein
MSKEKQSVESLVDLAGGAWFAFADVNEWLERTVKPDRRSAVS